MKRINILYSIDETQKDFSRYLWVSILSLLDNNREEKIHIYILSKYIEESNKKELIRIVEKYWKKIFFSEWEIIPKEFNGKLCLKWNRPIATYYRRFFLNCFDISDRILYLDCDTIINKNLSEFYNMEFSWNIIIANSDIPVTKYSRQIKYWLSKYVNGWVYLINVDLWKNIDLYKSVIMVNDKFWCVDYVDQDYINLILNDRIKIYDKLQCIVYYKWMNYKYSDYIVLHTVQKPNTWKYWFCPNKIEKLFDKYLMETKRKTYIGYKQNQSYKHYIFYIYHLTSHFFEYITLIVFWNKIWYKTKIFFSQLLNKLMNYLEILKKLFK